MSVLTLVPGKNANLFGQTNKCQSRTDHPDAVLGPHRCGAETPSLRLAVIGNHHTLSCSTTFSAASLHVQMSTPDQSETVVEFVISTIEGICSDDPRFSNFWSQRILSVGYGNVFNMFIA